MLRVAYIFSTVLVMALPLLGCSGSQTTSRSQSSSDDNLQGDDQTIESQSGGNSPVVIAGTNLAPETLAGVEVAGGFVTPYGLLRKRFSGVAANIAVTLAQGTSSHVLFDSRTGSFDAPGGVVRFPIPAGISGKFAFKVTNTVTRQFKQVPGDSAGGSQAAPEGTLIWFKSVLQSQVYDGVMPNGYPGGLPALFKAQCQGDVDSQHLYQMGAVGEAVPLVTSSVIEPLRGTQFFLTRNSGGTLSIASVPVAEATAAYFDGGRTDNQPIDFLPHSVSGALFGSFSIQAIRGTQNSDCSQLTKFNTGSGLLSVSSSSQTMPAIFKAAGAKSCSSLQDSDQVIICGIGFNPPKGAKPQ